MFVKSEGGTDQKEENSVVAVCLKCSGRCQTHRNSLMQVAVRKPSKGTSIALWRCEFYAWKPEFYAVYTAKLYTEVYAVYRPDRPTQCVSLKPPPSPLPLTSSSPSSPWKQPRHHRLTLRLSDPYNTITFTSTLKLTFFLKLSVTVRRQGHKGVGQIEETWLQVVGKFEGVQLRVSEDVVCFAPPRPLFLRVSVKIRKCCKRISLVKLANIAHVFTSVCG